MLKAGPDGVVHGQQGGGVRGGRHHARGVAQLAEGGALAQEVQRDLRVFELPQSFQQGGGARDPLLGVLRAEVRVSHWRAEQLEAAIGAEAETLREAV